MSSNTNEPPVFVEISDVVPNAVKIPAYKLATGDLVFDVFGGTHEIVVRRSAKGVDFRRDDSQQWERLSIDETITVIKGGK